MGYREVLAGFSIFITLKKKYLLSFGISLLSLGGALRLFAMNKMEQKMNKFPIYPKYEAGDYCGYEFDPHTDFTDFLSEARKHVSEGKVSATPPRSVELRNNNFENNVKKTSKKSWKSSLFSWLKSDKKKNEGSRETSKGSTINKPKRGCVSGPVPGISGSGTIAGRPNKPLSGPLTSLFSPMNRMDNEMPYLCLNKVKDSTPDVQSYGPVYLVT